MPITDVSKMLGHADVSKMLGHADVSKMLGHADVATTLRIYAHAMPNSQEMVAQAMEQILRRPPSSASGDA